MKCEDRSQEETGRQERCARGGAWRLPKNFSKLKEKDNVTFFSPSDEWSYPQSKRRKESLWWTPEQACMWSAGKTLTLPSWIPWKSLENPTTVVTANGYVQTKKEAEVYVRELDKFVTVMLLEDTPAVLSLGKLCEDHGYNYHRTSRQKPQLIRKWQKARMQHGELRTDRCPWSIDKLFKRIFCYIFCIFIAGSRNSHWASRINKKWEYGWWSTRRLVAWSSRNRKP